MTPDMPALVLGSSSPYRSALLERLQLPFETHSPDIDESPRAGEAPEDLVRRLARDKAAAVAQHYPAHRIITGDQVALAPEGDILGKPGNRDNAIEQLVRFSGRRVTLPTSVLLYNSASGTRQERVEHFTVVFRRLETAAIERYVDREEPFDCAGGFRAEGPGITLFERFDGRDPNTLIGLPLMALTDMLRAEGLKLP